MILLNIVTGISKAQLFSQIISEAKRLYDWDLPVGAIIYHYEIFVKAISTQNADVAKSVAMVLNQIK